MKGFWIWAIIGLALLLAKAKPQTAASQSTNSFSGFGFGGGGGGSGGSGSGGGGSTTLTVVGDATVTAMTTGSGLDLTDIPDFSLPNGWRVVYDMARATQTQSQLIELNKGFKQIAHNRLNLDSMYNTTPYANRIGFNNTQNDAAVIFTSGDPFDGSNIDVVGVPANVAKWQSVARFLGTDSPAGVNGLVLDIERWNWAGNSTYQTRIADVHTILFKTVWNDAGNTVGGSNNKPVICWGPYAPTELNTTDAGYTNINGAVNIAYTTPDRNGEYWHSYVTHDLVGFYYRNTDAADNFKSKMYSNLIVMELNQIYRNGTKPSLAMVYLHQENDGSHTTLPDYIGEYMAIMPAMVGINGYYTWSEGFHATIGDAHNWQSYKKFVMGLHRVSRISDIIAAGNPVFHRNGTEVSYDGGTTYVQEKPRAAHDAGHPVVRLVTNGSAYCIAACNPFAANDAVTLAVKVKVSGVPVDVTMTGKKTTLLRTPA